MDGMATASVNGKLPVDWQLLTADGPTLTNHVGCVIRNHLFIHGGITKYGSTTPSDKLFCMCLSSGSSWKEIHAAGSPSLSHHACVALEDRYMVLIGGWNGHKRVSTVHVFDAQEQKWLPIRDQGFPEGAGLSSHIATVLTSGEILIVGREGSLRIQRKHGNVYLLSGNVMGGVMTYKKMTNNTASRSGHSISGVGNVLYIIGGRDDQLVEFHGGFHINEPSGSLTSSFSNIAQGLKAMTKLPSGRKNHVTFAGNGCFIIHGGETFDGRVREPVGDMFLVTTKPHLTYFNIGSSTVARACHVCVSTGDKVVIHGGVSGKGNSVHGDCYELKIRKS